MTAAADAVRHARRAVTIVAGKLQMEKFLAGRARRRMHKC
jgi:hypothetical protein